MAKGRKRDIPPLRRKLPRREPRRQFVLYCEGKNTEPDYFAALKEVYVDALIDIRTVPAVGVPSTIAERASKHLNSGRRKKKNSFEENDEVWAVFDRDEHPHVNDAVQKCKGNGVGVALSNPCFEVWLILHIAPYDKPDDRHKAQHYLKKCCKDYDLKARKTANFKEFMPQIEEAEKRAERLLRKRNEEGMPYGVPSTTVFQLTRAIRSAAEASTLLAH